MNLYMKIISIVGMAGAGKSEVARLFEERGFTRIRFGALTDHEIVKRGLGLSEKNERQIREELRREHGMAAYAKLNLPDIESALQSGPVVIDGLYSWEEYLFLKERFGTGFVVIAVWASPLTRYHRLAHRRERPLIPEDAASRDKAELENMNKGGPIAMADFTLTNEGSMEDLIERVDRTIQRVAND